MEGGWTLEVNIKMIEAYGKIEIKFMVKLCQRVLDGKEITHEWKTSVVVPIYKKEMLWAVDHI